MTHRSAVLTAFLLISSAPAFASDGVIEINHTCASGPGCFPSDAPGYPIEINASAGSSYLLTSDLRLDNPTSFDADSTAILIIADRITLDLGGFAIRGPCLSFCAGGGGVGDGVSTAFFFESVEVRNGSVVGMGRVGISVGASGIVHDVRVTSNRGDGIQVGASSLVRASTSQRNTGRGIALGESATASGNTVRLNDGIGIEGTFGATIVENSVDANGSDGIRTGHSASIADNKVSQSQGHGIVTETGSTVRANTVYSNGFAAAGHGIVASTGSSVQENTTTANKGFGLSLSGQSAYGRNVVSGNLVGTVTTGVNLGGNYCTPSGNPSCP